MRSYFLLAIILELGDVFLVSTTNLLRAHEHEQTFTACSRLVCSDARLAIDCLHSDYIKIVTSKKFNREFKNSSKDLSLEHYMSIYPHKQWRSNLACLKSFCLFGCNTDDCNHFAELVHYCHLMCKPADLKQCPKKKKGKRKNKR